MVSNLKTMTKRDPIQFLKALVTEHDKVDLDQDLVILLLMKNNH